jgi:hypothetical protein
MLINYQLKFNSSFSFSKSQHVRLWHRHRLAIVQFAKVAVHQYATSQQRTTLTGRGVMGGIHLFDRRHDQLVVLWMDFGEVWQKDDDHFCSDSSTGMFLVRHSVKMSGNFSIPDFLDSP